MPIFEDWLDIGSLRIPMKYRDGKEGNEEGAVRYP